MVFIPASAVGHLGCFYFLAMVSRVAVNLCRVFISRGKIPRSGLPVSYDNSTFYPFEESSPVLTLPELSQNSPCPCGPTCCAWNPRSCLPGKALTLAKFSQPGAPSSVHRLQRQFKEVTQEKPSRDLKQSGGSAVPLLSPSFLSLPQCEVPR